MSEIIVKMEKEQEREWDEAQKIGIRVDLVEAAKRQLRFLAVVDQNRYLYQDHALHSAIYRYNAFWLPLLAKHLENPVFEDPLVVPLDCEWIWHCHRLNPVRYKLDCQKLYGRILGNHNVISSVQATSKSLTEEIWNKMYPEEPYELDINRSYSKDVLHHQGGKSTTYDLVSAVKRQISFTFQVSRPHMSDDLFLQEAEARYKGFLHLIRTNMKMGVDRFCVPAYDVDLMWHTHQLHPTSYCKDLVTLIGRVLQHDDTDSDRTKGSKLDTGHSETTKQWEETFGKRYWKAGAMYRGSTPTPVTQVPSEFRYEHKEIYANNIFDNPIQLSARKVVEIFLEFVEIKNLPEGHKDKLVVSFSKKQSDKLFNVKRSLSIFSESGEKQVAYFQCEPTGEFLFELQSESPSNKLKPKSSKVLGSCSLSLQELVSSRSQLSADKWLSVSPVSGLRISEPILLRVAVSFTPPTPAPEIFHLDSSQGSLPFFKSSCFLPLLKIRKVNLAKSQTYVSADDGKDICSLELRNIVKDAKNCSPHSLKEVHCITDSGEKHTVAEFLENNWVIKGMRGFFKLQNSSGNDGHLFELVGSKMVNLFPGRRLEFEPRQCGNQRREQEFITAVEFSVEYPYGKAIALFDLKLGTVKAVDEWIVLPGIILGFILLDILRSEGYSAFTAQNGDKETVAPGCTDDTLQAKVVVDECNGEKGHEDCMADAKIGGCGACSNCGGMIESGTCGSGKCGGSMVENGSGCGACGSCDAKMGGCGGCGGCGGGKCGSMVESGIGSGACGGGKCGGGCMVKSGTGSGACGGGCMVKSGTGCGACGAGNCGGCMVKSSTSCGACGAGECGGSMDKSSYGPVAA
ncbi:glycine-rich domain-containing protein 2-like isoform X2 [Silene latifolia]|uniref:glycine-rich domain-containing protein 2-like isoform X2 n=1 Tax=Silene latifolia TaxID=37657 RepID=UPI003D788A15